MRTPRLYLASELQTGAEVVLNNTAFHHAVRVLRLKTGAPVVLFNGTGGEYSARIETLERHRALVRCEEYRPHERESPLTTLLALGVAKGERMDYSLQKAVELGITAIQPLATQRSIVPLGDARIAKRTQHWRGIVIAACEQCGRNRIPDLLPPLGLADWLEQVPAGSKWVLHPRAAQGLRQQTKPDCTLSLLIGPEGGLAVEEIELAEQAGFSGIRLGPRILRTETAVVAALSAIQLIWGDLDP